MLPALRTKNVEKYPTETIGIDLGDKMSPERRDLDLDSQTERVSVT